MLFNQGDGHPDIFCTMARTPPIIAVLTYDQVIVGTAQISNENLKNGHKSYTNSQLQSIFSLFFI